MSNKRSRARRRVLAPTILVLTGALSAAGLAAERPSHALSHKLASPGTAPLTPTEQAAQVLNRFTFGPRPGEVAQVAQMGWEAWFEQQLHPASIPDATVDKRMAQFPALQLTSQQIAVEFPDGQVIRRIDSGKLAMPTDPQLAGGYEVLLARYRRKQTDDKLGAEQAQPTATAQQAPIPGQLEAQKQAQKQQQKHQDQAQARVLADQVLGCPKNERMQAIFKMPVDQRMVLTGNVTEPERGLLLNDFTPRERELFQMMGGGFGGNGAVANEMQQAKVVRAVLSERQLQEVMTDFWFNHFNVDLGKSGDEVDYAPSYERDAIRAHALGKFRDLLLATAQHPAMLLYLDNWQSIGPDSQAAGRARADAKAGQRGLNENYGREVMELHTVGVDGGYAQPDVTALANIMTGWTIEEPQVGGPFVFDPRKHEPGAKQWFGHTISAGGMNEGVEALTWLAAQPQTAHMVSYQLAQRFVSDTPPPALVNQMAAAYMSSDGDISAVLRAMVHSPEFFSRANFRNKVKTPLEYVASSLRATDTDPSNPGALANELRTMGEPLYRCLPPTGYASTADHWMNSSALVDRLNYALELTGSRFGGMRFDAPRLLAAGLLDRPALAAPAADTHRISLRAKDQVGASGEDEALALMEQMLVPGAVSVQTNEVIRQQLAAAVQPAPASEPEPLRDPNQTLDKLAAMILGSPEFQLH